MYVCNVIIKQIEKMGDFKKFEFDWDLDGLDVTLVVWYQEGEDEVRYYDDGTGYPGCGSTIDLQEILVDDVNIIDLLKESILEDINYTLRYNETDYFN